ncbi:MAG: Asp23/Gls24 family envelope stress response protein [Ruminococcaceae bacterium]|nr:Asp23/Gls24 family envelope stress response protein [Oscillospiraceae bacterium]
MGEKKEYVSQNDELGNIHIAEDVLAVISTAAALEVEGVSGLHGGNRDIVELLGKKNMTRGVNIEVDEDGVQIELGIMIKYGYTIQEVARAVQDAVATNVESMSSLTVKSVNVNIGGITFEKAKKAE